MVATDNKQRNKHENFQVMVSAVNKVESTEQWREEVLVQGEQAWEALLGNDGENAKYSKEQASAYLR